MRYLLSLSIFKSARDEIKKAQDKIEDKLSYKAKESTKFIRTDDLHLTVGFISKLQQEDRADLEEAVEWAADKQTDFKCSLAGLETRETDYVPKIIAAKVKTKTNRIKYLRRDIVKYLSRKNIEHSQQMNKPHITVAWIKDSQVDLPKVSNIQLKEIGWKVNNIKIMRVKQLETGYEYEVYKEFPL